jgi:nitrite reductase/ring-hydroxylating ferredoxin subunit
MEALSEDPPSPLPPPARGGGAEDLLPLPLREGEGGRGLRALCQFDELPDGAAKGFGPAPGGFTTGSSARWQAGLVAIRQGDDIFVYVNSCPHLGTPLEWTPDRFLSLDRSRIVCATHGAEFRIADGECLRGPCFGERLEPVVIQIEDGTIFVPEDAGL